MAHKQSRLLIATMLLPVSMALGAPAIAQNHDHADGATPGALTAAKSGAWSSASTWAGGKVPSAGDAVVIGRGMEVVLDTNAPQLRGITVQGKLSFADTRDIALESEWIYVPGGELEIGTEAKPHQHKATITLTDNVPGENINTMGDRGIMLMAGTLNIHGTRSHTWSKLDGTAAKGATSIRVLDAGDWRVGDEIVLASTDYNPRQAERRTITAVKGNRLSFAQPLEFMHFGQMTFGVDERGEVGMLTRNIKVQASDDHLDKYFGGHIMAMASSKMYVDGVELNRMGQHLTLARYPIHFHVLGDAAGMYVKNASIHDTYNRCVTVHGTNDLKVENNVTYNTVGHCYFMEDGIEHGNAFIHNLAIQTKCHPTLDCVPTNIGPNGEALKFENRQAQLKASFQSKNVLLPSDNTASSFWITNPDNIYIDNVAAGSDQAGFWLSLPEHPNGAFLGTEISAKTWPRRTLLREFRNNTAHSNYDGFMFDRNIAENNTYALAGSTYLPLVDKTDPMSEALETNLVNLTTYKNRNQGFWGRGELLILRNLKSADNAIGMTQSSGSFGTERFTSLVTDSLFVGETENVGNPRTPEEVAYGRSLPKPLIPDYPIRAYEYYDYRNDVQNTTFMNYQDNARRKTGALSWLMFNSSGVTTASTISSAKYINAKPVYFPNYDTRFDNDNRGGGSWRTLSIRDLDGTTSGIPNSHIILHDGVSNSVATDSSCTIHPEWNAAVCAGDLGRLAFSPPRQGFAFGRPGAPRPAGANVNFGNIGAPPAPQAPITLRRNDIEFRNGNGATVRAGTEVQVLTERDEVPLSISEMDQGSWVIFQLPGFSTADSGTQLSSLSALRSAKETSWFSDGASLWVKLVVADPPQLPIRPLNMQAGIVASRKGRGG